MHRHVPRLLLPLLLLAVAFIQMAPAGASPVRSSSTGVTTRSSLVVYNTVQGLLAGDLAHAVSIGRVEADLAQYPRDWPVAGVGTTNWPYRTGESFPDGTAGDLRFWWADPDSASQAAVVDLRSSPLTAAARFPFLALAVADPSRAFTWTARVVPDMHAWLAQQLASAGIELAGLLLEGRFSEVKTTVSSNIPETGLDLSGGYVGTEFFRFGDYAPAVWRINGVYTATPALQPVIAAAGAPLHLHGFQPAAMLGGHITSAAAQDVTVTVWPLEEMIVRRGTLTSK